MKKINIAILFVFILSIISCSDQEHEYDKPFLTSQRVKFDNQENFFNSLMELSKMDRSELSNWIVNNNPSLGSNGYISSSIDDDRDYFKAIFNINNEFQVGDSVIWYYEGKMLLVSTNGDEKEISTNKLKPLECQIWGEIEKELITIDDEQMSKGTLGGNAKGANYQVSFDRPKVTRYKYKYVYEMQSYKTSVLSSTVYELVFVNKLEYKYNSWGESDTPRTCSTELRGNVTSEIDGVGISLISNFSPYYKGTDQLKYNSGILLARVSGPNGWHNFKRWSYNLSFTITQEITGEPETRRSNSFTF